MASGKNSRLSILTPRYFGLILGLAVFSLFIFIDQTTDIFRTLETRIMDVHFNLKNSLFRSTEQEGVITEYRNPKISPDILLVGIDNATLDQFGRWPFDRRYHADLLNSFTRIQNQNERESAILLDVLFGDIAPRPYDDVVLLDAMAANGNVALQPQLTASPPVLGKVEEYDRRFQVVLEQFGEIVNPQGELSRVPANYGLEAPLVPYGENISAYGHPNFLADGDEIYRRQSIVARYSQKISEYRVDELTPNMEFGDPRQYHLTWLNSSGIRESVELPLTERKLETLQRELQRNGLPRAEDIDGDGSPDTESYYVSVYRDHYLPAISLALAVEYFGLELSDIEVEFGSHVLLPSPQRWDPDAGAWVPYSVISKYPVIDDQGNVIREGETRLIEEIRIPIDERGNMLINYMGARSTTDRNGHQTYPVRSYAAYASRVPSADPETWPRTKAVGGKVLMVGAFTLGMADDEKTTPLGLMFGVEIHANALNTILMDNFIVEFPAWVNASILLLLVLLVAFVGSRINTGWALLMVVLLLVLSFGAVTFLFEYQSVLIDWATPAIAVLFAFVITVVYRVLSEESDKRRIKDMFGKYVSPVVVERMMEEPPELGGDDVDVSIFFSDIRSFSTMSETMTPQDLVSLLNEYLTAMTDCLISWDGTLDKYIGDAVMAFWGAPLNQEDHAVRACKCAVQQIRILDELNKNWPPQKQIHIGIGINSGVSTVGNMGSLGRMNYTVMGDHVNLASRLEGTNKQYKTQIIISESTKLKIEHEPFILRELDEIRVKGKRKPVTIYEILDYEGDLAAPNISKDSVGLGS